MVSQVHNIRQDAVTKQYIVLFYCCGSLQDMATVPTVLATTVPWWPGRLDNASCHSHSLENTTHLAGTGVQVLIFMGQMQPASSSIQWSVDARCDSHTDFHLQQKIEYKSGFHGNDYEKVVYLV